MHVDELWKELEEALTLGGDTVALIEANSDHWNGIQLVALAHQLRGLSEFPSSLYSNAGSRQQLIAIYLETSAIYVGAVLAAVSSGCAFLPLDPRWPQEKLLQVLGNCKPSYIYYAEKHTGILGACGPPPIADSFLINQSSTPSPCCRLLSITPDVIASVRSIRTRKALDTSIIVLKDTRIGSGGKTALSNNIAYVMMTSGSTGSSTKGGLRGVCGTALGIYERCRWMSEAYPFQKGDVVAFKTNPCFVDSIWEIFGPLLSGGIAVTLAVPFSISLNPYSLVHSLIRYDVTHLTAIPTVWHQIVNACCCYDQGTEIDQQWRQRRRLRQVVSSGEQLPWQLLNDMRDILLPKECRILNLYGSTEVAADATFLDCTNVATMMNSNSNLNLNSFTSSAGVPVGLPLKGVVIVLAKIKIDEKDREEEKQDVELVHPSPGAIGEVWIGGWGVAAGYYHNYQYPFSKMNDAAIIATVSNESAHMSHEYGYRGTTFIQLDIQGITPYCIGSLDSEENNLSDSSTDGIVGMCTNEEKRGKCAGKTLFYCSGDVGSIDTQGRLCILGRTDFQIKINGVRIDLLDVEEVIRGHHAVHAVAVKSWPAGEKMKTRLLGVYIELEDGSSGRLDDEMWNALKDELKFLCASTLTSALAEIDFSFEKMVKLPRSSGGKVDRSALPPPLPPPGVATNTSVVDGGNVSQGRSKRMKIRELSEIEVHQAFATALGHSDFEPFDNLFTVLGGTSITAVTISKLLEIKVEDIFQNSTVRSLAAATFPCQVEGSDPPTIDIVKQLTTSSVSIIPQLQVLWSSKMKGCVDTPPVFLQQQHYDTTTKSIDSKTRVVGPTGRAVVFAASHGGDIACFDASSGEVIWSIYIPNEQPDPGMVLSDCLRAENEATAGAAASRVLVVGFNSGEIKFLDSSTGEEFFRERSTIEIGGGGMRAAPAVGPLGEGKNLVWAAGHGKKLIAINNDAHCVATLHLPAAVSAGITVSTDVVYVACLDGTLMAVKEKERKNQRASTATTLSDKIELSVLWKLDCGSPIFGTPTLINALEADSSFPPSSLNVPTTAAAAETHSLLVVVTASGVVWAVDATTGKEVWHAVIDPGGYYIPAVYLKKWNMVLLGSRSGQLTWIDVADGSIQDRYQVIGGVAITGLLLLPTGPNISKDKEARDFIYIIASTADGQILVLHYYYKSNISQNGDGGAVTLKIAGRFQLPASSFSTLIRGQIFEDKAVIYVGCRDDHIYCLILPENMELTIT